MSTLPHRDVFGLVGTVIADRFRVERTLGEGGYGVVYGGTHLLLGVPVAIKCLKPMGFSPEERERSAQGFLREARILFGLSHPSIVRLYDVGVIPDLHVPYAVLELLSGTTVADEITRRASIQKHFDRDELGATFGPILEAVAFAHERGVIHRDLKPSNMMLVLESESTLRGSASGSSARTRLLPKVLDFGTARVDAAHVSGSMTTATAGYTGGQPTGFTPLYAAPEQWDRALGPTTARTDVFALGLTLAEACLLRYPFETSQGLLSIFKNALDERSRPLIVEARPDLPVEFEHVILRALRVQPGERYPDARELLASFRAALRISPTTAPLEKPITRPSGSHARPPVPMTMGSAPVGPHPFDARTPPPASTMKPHVARLELAPPPRPRGSALPWIVGSIGFAVALIALSVAGVLVLRRQTAEGEETASSPPPTDDSTEDAGTPEPAAETPFDDAGSLAEGETEDAAASPSASVAPIAPRRKAGHGSGNRVVVVSVTGQHPFWTQNDVLRVADAHKAALNECAAEVIDAAGTIDVIVTPDKSGVVEHTVCSMRPQGDDVLCHCIEATMSAWRYPPARAKLGHLEAAPFIYTLRVVARSDPKAVPF